MKLELCLKVRGKCTTKNITLKEKTETMEAVKESQSKFDRIEVHVGALLFYHLLIFLVLLFYLPLFQFISSISPLHFVDVLSLSYTVM